MAMLAFKLAKHREVEISLREREEEVGGKREGEVGGEGKREERAREQRGGG